MANGFSIAPDLLDDLFGSLQVSPPARGSAAPELPVPAREITPRVETPRLPEGPGFLEQLIPALLFGASPLLSEGLQAPFRQRLAQEEERKRRSKSSQETHALTQMISAAMASGDPASLANTIKQLGSLEGLEPETVKALSQLQIELGEQIGARTRTTNALQNLDPSLLGNKGRAFASLLSQGVDEDTAKALVAAIPERKVVPLPTGDAVLVVNEDGSFSVEPIPGRAGAKPGRLLPGSLKDKIASAIAGSISPELAKDLADFGIDASDKEQVRQVQNELTKLEQQRITLSAANLGVRQREFSRIPDADRRMLSESQASFDQLTRIKTLFEQTPAFQTGTVSKILRSAIATNEAARAFSEVGFLPLGKLSGAEKDFASAYNALLIKLRSFSGDPRFSNEDAERTVKGLGSGLLGGQFPLQLREAMSFIGRLHDTTVLGLERSDFDVSRTPRLLEKLPRLKMNKQIAAEILVEAGGDRNKAEQIAEQRGYDF